jgi:putative redox protein
MPEIVAEHLSGVAFRVTHRGHSIVMDQPVENNGEDSGMTPPELFASSLAGCVGYYVANYCKQAGLSTDGLLVSCVWDTVDKPKRINPIHLSVALPGLPEKRRRAVERVAQTCLLHATLTQQPDVKISVNKALDA